jgi:hypothetical protein
MHVWIFIRAQGAPWLLIKLTHTSMLVCVIHIYIQGLHVPLGLINSNVIIIFLIWLEGIEDDLKSGDSKDGERNNSLRKSSQWSYKFINVCVITKVECLCLCDCDCLGIL